MKAINLFVIYLLLCIPIVAQEYNSEIDANDIKEQISYLASDELKGRLPGTEGDKDAAGYIKNKFEEAGLGLIGENGFQYFELTTGIELGANNYLKLGSEDIELRESYIPLNFSANGELNREVVFVGYGFTINKDTIQWDDYKNVDVKGKWVMAFRADPDLDNPNSIFAKYSSDRYKVMNAQDHGAAGLLLVNPVEYDKADELKTLRPRQGVAPAGIPVVQIKREVADAILQPCGKSISDLEKSNKKQSGGAVETKSRLDVAIELVSTKATTTNVLGYLEGTANSDEYIVVGAHYDHLGMGGPSSRMQDTVGVHNGADDNASGVSMVIELAQKAAKEKPELDILFMAFGAEEMGLVGSSYYVNHPLLNLKNAKAMINLDMVGRLNRDNSLYVYGTGTAKEFDALLREAIDTNEFSLVTSRGGTGPSDHSSFYSENIPVLFFSTGVHEQYHTPLDKVELINFKGAEKVGEAIYKVLEMQSEKEQSLTFVEAETKDKPNMRRRMKVTMGIVPAHGEQVKGLGVAGVRPGGPAQTGGLQKGDVIVALDGKEIGNIYDYMYRMAEFSKGQRITVKVTRDGKEQMLLVEL